MLPRTLHYLLAFVAAVILSGGLGATIQTQFNLNRIVMLGAPVHTGDRLAATVHDLVHFAPSLIAMQTPALIIGFGVAALLARHRPHLRTLLYVIAGPAALMSLFLGLDWLLPIRLIPATATTAGLLALSAPGMLSGWLLARATRPRRAPGT